MANKVKEVKAPEIKEVVKAVHVAEEKAHAKTEPKKETKKTTAKKAASAKKPAAKNAAAKTALAKKGNKKAAKPAKKPVAKKAALAKPAKIVTTSVLQAAGNEFDFDKIVKAVEGLKKKNAGKNLDIYIKPEDRAIYYVVNGKDGKKIDL